MNQYKIGQRVRLINTDNNFMQYFSTDECKRLHNLVVRVVAYIGEFNNTHFWQLETPIGYRNFADGQFRGLISKTAKINPVLDLIYEMKWLDKIKKNFNVGDYIITDHVPSPNRYSSLMRAIDAVSIPRVSNMWTDRTLDDEPGDTEVEVDLDDDLFS